MRVLTEVIMKELEAAILKYGHAVNEQVLKVDTFLNHQIDPNLMYLMAADILEHFKDKKIDKIITIEASGIAPALMVAYQLNVPLVFFKKATSSILNSELYQCQVHSFTKNKDYTLTASMNYIQEGEKLLFVDDFLANGEAALGAINIVKQADAEISGIAIIIEKSFQPGRKRLTAEGYDVYSLARIKQMAANHIEFIENE